MISTNDSSIAKRKNCNGSYFLTGKIIALGLKITVIDDDAGMCVNHL